VLDVVLTAAYGMTGRWREQYEALDHERARTLLEVFGVGRFAERRFGTLSEGERKRTQIARALMTDPELLLLDEPAAGLDLGGREELVAALAELAQDRRSPVIVLVTHHVEEVPEGFTHGLLLREGQVRAAGPLDQVLTAEQLSDAFGMGLTVDRHEGRWSARAAVGDAR
jgi:iron complex transport system ATP-binding protein